jgi:hypothetical protein
MTQDWKKEFDYHFNYIHNNQIFSEDNDANDFDDIKKFIAEELATAKAEGVKEERKSIDKKLGEWELNIQKQRFSKERQHKNLEDMDWTDIDCDDLSKEGQALGIRKFRIATFWRTKDGKQSSPDLLSHPEGTP